MTILLVGVALYLLAVLIIYRSLFSFKALATGIPSDRAARNREFINRVYFSFALPFITLRFALELVIWSFRKQEVS